MSDSSFSGFAQQVSSPVVFSTKEQAQARASDSLDGYWRLRDPLCAKFLHVAKDPVHFPAAKAFFPFIRAASVLQMPTSIEFLPSWLNLAFYSGFVFGENLTAEAEEILEHNRVESAEALHRLSIIRSHLGRSPATPGNLFDTFKHLCESRAKPVPADGALNALTAATFDTFKAGLAAATLAKHDPFLIEFVEGITPPLTILRIPLSWRFLMSSPFLAWGQSPLHSMAHPLIKVAAAHYPRSPREREIILPYFIEQLSACGQLSEEEFPAAETDIIKLVRRALEYGFHIKAHEPQRLAEVFGETGATQLEAVRQTIRKLVERAGGTEPAVLTDAILHWHRKAFGWREPATYGQCLERMVHCADFAIWIPWAMPRGSANSESKKWGRHSIRRTAFRWSV